MENRMQNSDKKRVALSCGVTTLAYSTRSIVSRYNDVFVNGENGFEWERFGLHPAARKASSLDAWIECGEFDCWIEDIEPGTVYGRYAKIDSVTEEELRRDREEQQNEFSPFDPLLREVNNTLKHIDSNLDLVITAINKIAKNF